MYQETPDFPSHLSDKEDNLTYLKELLEEDHSGLLSTLFPPSAFKSTCRFGAVQASPLDNHLYIRIQHTPMLHVRLPQHSLFTQLLIIPASDTQNVVILTGHKGTNLNTDVAMCL